jgi:hypothetical protein
MRRRGFVSVGAHPATDFPADYRQLHRPLLVFDETSGVGVSMSRRFAAIFLAGIALAAVTAQAPLSLAATSGGPGVGSVFCSRLGKELGASAGAYMYCLGAQSSSGTPSSAAARIAPAAAMTPFAPNVDAASLREDVSPSGARVYGQAETSVAAVGRYVVEAWIDATGQVSPCPSPRHKEELTGFGFSNNGGTSFEDEGGIPNRNCATYKAAGDPSVAGWQSGSKTYFYISSMYLPTGETSAGIPASFLSLTACQVNGSDSTAGLTCGQPVKLAASTLCPKVSGGIFLCSLLDKDFLAIDPNRGRIYVSYTEFGQLGQPNRSSNGIIELAVCDIGRPNGSPGPAGGTAKSPVCLHGGSANPTHPLAHPYFVVAPAPARCEDEGAYPAVDPATGDVYVAYEFNWATNFLVPGCASVPITNNLAFIPFHCLTLTMHSPCPAPTAATSTRIVSLDLAVVPGYNRNLFNGAGVPVADFPRIAVSDRAGTVSMVWNDARAHPLGDILLRSYALGSLVPVQSSPVRLDKVPPGGGTNILPALRLADAKGNLDVSWFQRSSANTAVTSVMAAMGVNPRTTRTPTASLVTTRTSNWDDVSSDIIPNFGDYTDNVVSGGRLYVAWTDGRLGVPQPFEANAPIP